MRTSNTLTRLKGEYLAAGFALFPCVTETKAPALAGWRLTVNEPLQDLEQLGETFGINLSDEDFILDVDPRRFVDGVNQLTQLWAELNLPTPCQTFIVTTGGGGCHVYFKKPANVQLRQRVPGYDAIEIKTAGRFVIGAESLHPSGARYTVTRLSPHSIAAAPENLIEFCKQDDSAVRQGEEFFSDDEATKIRFRSYALRCAPAIQNSGGDATTYELACEGKSYGLSEDACFEIMLDVFNPRCEPEWTADELREKVSNAYNYSRSSAGALHPSTDFIPLEQAPRRINETPWEIKWDWTQVGETLEYRNSIINVVNFFNVPTWNTQGQEYPNPLLGLVQYNLFSNNIEFTRNAPWHRNSETAEFWSDQDTTELNVLLNRQNFRPTVNILDSGVLIAARLRQSHPIRDYLNSLKWDGTPRLDRLLPTYAGTADTPYTREIGKNTLRAACARVMEPGCQHDHVLVLEGAQDLGKTNFVRVLGGKYFADPNLDPRGRDTAESLMGCWIIEAAEMSFARQKDVDDIKGFITRTVDRVRLAYARRSQNIPRQMIMIGTANVGTDGYLRDRTGNRRFWPVVCTKIDNVALKRDRDQLFAEAFFRYEQGEKFYITDKTITGMAKEEQDKRVQTEAWSDIIAEFLNRLGTSTPKFITSEFIYYSALALNPGQVSHVVKVRVGNAMQELGYERQKSYDSTIHKQRWHWKKISSDRYLDI